MNKYTPFFLPQLKSPLCFLVATRSEVPTIVVMTYLVVRELPEGNGSMHIFAKTLEEARVCMKKETADWLEANYPNTPLYKQLQEGSPSDYPEGIIEYARPCMPPPKALLGGKMLPAADLLHNDYYLKTQRSMMCGMCTTCHMELLVTFSLIQL